MKLIGCKYMRNFSVSQIFFMTCFFYLTVVPESFVQGYPSKTYPPDQRLCILQ